MEKPNAAPDWSDYLRKPLDSLVYSTKLKTKGIQLFIHLTSYQLTKNPRHEKRMIENCIDLAELVRDGLSVINPKKSKKVRHKMKEKLEDYEDILTESGYNKLTEILTGEPNTATI